MAAKAFILIETSVGNSRRVADMMKGIPEIEAVDVVTGPYDVIAIVNADDMGAVADLVTGKIHSAGGVTRTTTCVAVGN
jgi:DNA-binding Lrp family transcriptional regulator